MKIALITSNYEEIFGGNEYYLAKYFSKKGHEVIIYVSTYSVPRYGPIRKISTGSKLRNVTVKRLPSMGIKSKGMNFLIGLKHELKKDKPDIIHVQEWIMPLAWSIMGFNNVVLTQRIQSYPFSLSWYAHSLGKMLLKKAKAITVLSEDALSSIHSILPEGKKAIKIPNGVDTELFRPGKRAEKRDKIFTIVYVGRFSREKGIKGLIEACEKLPMPFRLMLVGDGPEKKSIEKLVHAKGLGKNIEMSFEKHEKLPKIYQKADVCVIPSLIEPFGLVTLEALSCGIPVIGSDIGGMRDIITPEVGIKVQPGNVSQLRDALIKMYDPKFRKTCANEARAYALKRYGWDAISEKYLQVYREAMR